MRLRPEPIQPDMRDNMNALAHALDQMLNPELPKREVWFFLACGNMAAPDGDEPAVNRFNYISNADKLDVRATLVEILARIEGRIQDGGNA